MEIVKNEKQQEPELGKSPEQEARNVEQEKTEESKEETKRMAIEPERVERILGAERLSINRDILESFVQFVYDYMITINDDLKSFSTLINEANDSGKNKRKLSVNIKQFSNFINDSIKFLFRMQGTITTVQQDIDAEGYKQNTEKDENVNMGKQHESK